MTVMWLSLVILPAVVIELVLGVLMIIGAVQMLRVRSHGWAMVASFMALWPCSPTSLLGLPMGIWALIVLGRPNVKAAFQQIPPSPAPPSDSTPGAVSERHSGGSVFFAVALLLLIVVGLSLGPRLLLIIRESGTKVSSGVNVRADAAHPGDRTFPGEQWIDYGNVQYPGPQAPMVSDLLAERLQILSGQRSGVNQAFQKYHQGFHDLEARHARPKIVDTNGHQTTQIDPFSSDLSKLEEQFWKDLESTLTGQQLTRARRMIHLRAGQYAGGDAGFRIEIWRVGKIDPWYHWKVDYLELRTLPMRVVEPSTGPELPENYRRFWTEPPPEEALRNAEAVP